MLTDEQFGRWLGARLRHETADVHAAPDLVRALTARHRRNRRTWAMRTAIATPVAAATVLVTTAGPGAPSGKPQAISVPPSTTTSTTVSTSSAPPRVVTVAYVRAQTVQALDQAAQYVIYVRNTFDDGHNDEWIDTATQRHRTDGYDRGITVVAGPDGRPPASPPPLPPVRLHHSGLTRGPAGDQDVLTIDYDQRTWFTSRFTYKPPPSAGPDITDPASVRDAIATGTVELLGTENVDGRDTLHLRLPGPTPPNRIDMWVDTQTYLPVRANSTKLIGKQPRIVWTMTYSWLPRTPENLAHLELTPPPDFRRVNLK